MARVLQAGLGTPRRSKVMVIFRKAVRGASEQSLARFVARARRATGLCGRVAVLVTSSSELRRLNRRFRRHDRATDVLSFPAGSGTENASEGDIAISAEIALANAARLGHSVAEELKILVLHGILHLAGYDHETDYGQMARQEARLRRKLGLPETLIERTRPEPALRSEGGPQCMTAGTRKRRR